MTALFGEQQVRHERVLTFVGSLLLGLWCFMIVKKSIQFPLLEYDTRLLVDGTQALRRCLAEGRWGSCAEANYFALFQYVPAYFLTALGLIQQDVLIWLLRLNTLLFVLSILLGTFYLRWARGDWHWAVFALFALASPWSWYARTTFSEGAAAAVLLLLACLLSGARVANWKGLMLVFFLGIAAGITKDTAAPFVVLLAAGARSVGAKQVASKAEFWRPVVAATLGAGIAFILGLLFNEFRYGQWTNRYHFDPIFFVPTLTQQLIYWVSLWVSPNGGILFFFPVFALAFVVASFRVLFHKQTQTHFQATHFSAPSERVTFILIGMILAGLTFGFSKWYAPTGWVAIGPRLILPWMPALMIILLQSKELGLERVKSQNLLVRLCALAIFLFFSIGFLGTHFHPQIMTEFFGPTDFCPRPAYIQKEPEYYYHCMNHGLWASHQWMIYRFFRAMLEGRFLSPVLGCVILTWVLFRKANVAR